MLTLLVLLGRTLVILLLTPLQQGKDMQLEKFPIPLFPWLRLGEEGLLSIARGGPAWRPTACVLLFLSFTVLSGFGFPPRGS